MNLKVSCLATIKDSFVKKVIIIAERTDLSVIHACGISKLL